MFNLYSYVLTCPKTRGRLRSFFDGWNVARFDYLTRNPQETRDFKITTVWGMNSERFPRSPFWRVADHPVNCPDKLSGNGLNRLGHTACYWGHVQQWRQALGEHDDDFDAGVACFFEDDCRLDVDFWTRAFEGFAELPDNWDILYFGGQHCIHGRPRPEAFSENLYKIQNVNRLHAYAIRLSSLPKIILWFEENHDWGHNFHDPKTGKSEAEVDYAIGHLTETGFLNGFALRPWVCGQAPGMSATQGRFENNGRWEL
jgi:hypothetical protein